jgi:threonylcarbamoyladenosine tRNA methylthiotransferase MtaB
MGRRYDTAFYAELLGRVRRAIPDVALHADLIVGFPGEDEAAWHRTVAFVTDLDLAGIHVFRYSARPGTPAARMVGQVNAQTKKRRANEALVLAAEARRRFAARQIGRDLRVLFERRAADGRWLGHAENHVLVSAVARPGVAAQAAPMRGAIGIVRAEAVDPAAPDRITGRVMSAVPAVPAVPAVSADRPLADSAAR